MIWVVLGTKRVLFFKFWEEVVQISRHWRLNSIRYRLEGYMQEDGEVALENRQPGIERQFEEDHSEIVTGEDETLSYQPDIERVVEKVRSRVDHAPQEGDGTLFFEPMEVGARR